MINHRRRIELGYDPDVDPLPALVLKRSLKRIVTGIAIVLAMQISRLKGKGASHSDMVGCTGQEGVLIRIGQQVLERMTSYQKHDNLRTEPAHVDWMRRLICFPCKS